MTIQKTETSNAKSEALWIESESIRLLMQTRRGTTGLAALAMLLMAVQLYGSVDTELIAGWLAVSLLVMVCRVKFKASFMQRMATSTNAAKAAFVDRISLLWTLNAFTWGITGWIFFSSIPLQNLYVCALTLNIVGFVAVHNLTSHRKIARQFINVLVGTQIVGALFYIGVVLKFDSPQIHYIHLVGLVFYWSLLRVLDNKFYRAYHRDLALQHKNMMLIQHLNRQAELLEHEKIVVMNANATIKRFYSSAAHDIRQPVYALNVYADLIQDEPSQTLALVPKIKESCKAIDSLFRSLFDFEKIKAGELKVSLQNLDLAGVFRDLQRNYQPMADAKKIELRVLPATGIISADNAILKGILNHLVANAIKYTNHGGVLVVLRKKSKKLSFEVWDTGIGIDSSNQHNVFSEFFKVHEQSSADEGFGLGLSVVKHLSKYIEGSNILLTSKLGRGSVFRLELPLSLLASQTQNT